jgi:acyl-CoA thioester hydrolase
MSRVTPPSFDQVIELPAAVESTVTPDWIDTNGHMNIRHYFDLGALAVQAACIDAGFDPGSRRRPDVPSGRRQGLFTAEHHLRYYSEVHEGSRLSAHCRVIGRSGKAVHLMIFLVDHARETLACTIEVVLLHVSLANRRTSPLPDDAAAGFDRAVAVGKALGWDPPLCGAMGVRHA